MVQKEVARLDELDRLHRKQDLAEVINVAYVGSQPDKNHKNANKLASFHRKLQGDIDRLLNRGRQTVWDTMPRGRRSRKL